MKKFLNQRGQILIETLLAILIAAIIIGAVASLVVVSMRSSQSSGNKGDAISLAQEGIEALGAVADSDWHDLYLPPDGAGSAANKGESYPYYIYKNGSSWSLSSNAANRDIVINGVTYSRTIYIYNVNRNTAGDREIVAVGGAEDPSTQKVKVVISHPSGQDTALSQYFTRWKNNASVQTNWSGGAGQVGPIAAPNTQYGSDDGNIDMNNPAGSIKLKQ